jgi:hypothetical protein
MKREHQEARGTGTFPTGIDGGLHPLGILQTFLNSANHTAHLLTKSTGSTASFKTNGKFNTNLIAFYRQWGSFPVHTSLALPMSNQSQWHFHSSCRSCFHCVFVITIDFQIPNLIYRQ